MRYRVVELRPWSVVPAYVRGFSNAYAAVDFITAAWFRGDPSAGQLHLLDEDDRVVLSPEDIIGGVALDLADRAERAPHT